MKQSTNQEEQLDHPAFYIGEKSRYVFFRDRANEIFFLRRFAGVPKEQFTVRSVIDAQDAVPVTADPVAESLAIDLIEH